MVLCNCFGVSSTAMVSNARPSRRVHCSPTNTTHRKRIEQFMHILCRFKSFVSLLVCGLKSSRRVYSPSLSLTPLRSFLRLFNSFESATGYTVCILCSAQLTIDIFPRLFYLRCAYFAFWLLIEWFLHIENVHRISPKKS